VVADAEGSDPVTLEVTLSNTGRDRADWAVSWDAAWLAVEPEGGDLAEGRSQPLTFTFDPAVLGNGSGTATLTFEAPGATNDGLAVPVVLNLWNPPVPCAEPAVVEVEAEEAGQVLAAAVHVHNCSAGPLRWSAGSEDGWIAVVDPEGDVADGEVGTVRLQVTAPDEPGEQTGTVTLAAAGADVDPVEVEVHVVLPRPCGCGHASGGSVAGLLAGLGILARRRRR
jgi:hypothetical protein